MLLDGTGAEAWRAIADAGCLSAAIDTLAATYGLPGADLMADTATFIGDLKAIGVLVSSTPENA